jgi:RNA polymerase sigma-70 factor (ECF subfamily)
MTGTVKLDPTDVERGFDQYRGELTGYCYRMLGSAFEADDAVQETLIRAWRSIDTFEGRASLRSWLYRIASNVCFDQLKGRKRRAMPMDLTEVGSADGPVVARTDESMWITPIPDGSVVPPNADPAEQAVVRESVRIAFVAALQHLPARQRAVLILREVLKWHANEVAELLDTTVVSVNSALQRARATLAERNVTSFDAPQKFDPEQQALLARYVDAFERFDMDTLVRLLRDDFTMSMPPYPLWLRGPDQFRAFNLGPGIGCKGSKLAPIDVNGTAGFAQWRTSPDGGYDAWCLHVLEISDGTITSINYFVDATLFPRFGLPLHLDA